ncbi:hypothetical protein PpBr36_08935 [Pyricularia pennisetigena]|uniref:hypothetical protein n=1 Tax=Pyricularia pennisetigena TaxID=1578925 RepID=UPI00114F0604|nr:hypothetical protein PpBr36_08935 [Pyricularia pennisetigena]TLS24882.1 hypothetical protein PpBr36_08935 [Pyricularia pennisetigena]
MSMTRKRFRRIRLGNQPPNKSMQHPKLSPIRQAWYKWKALRLPWRKRFLIGLDLQGNTFWEFRDLRGDGPVARWRRIVKFPSSTHYSDVKVSPQWSQWLRHVREHPPSLEEQQQDLVRQQRMKLLAAEADARWKAKPSVLDPPSASAGRHGEQSLRVEEGGSVAEEQHQQRKDEGVAVDQQQQQEQQTSPPQAPATDPWAKARGGPSEDWQPEAWKPTSTRKR